MSHMRRAFTLIELLVVIAVVALLISMLLPAIAKARNAARTVICLSNERQLGSAVTSYLGENKTYYPGEHWETGTRYSIISWMPRIRKYMDKNTQVFYCPMYPKDFRWTPFEAGTAYDATVQSPKVRDDAGMFVGYDQQEPLITGGGGARNNPDFLCYGYNGWGVKDFTVPHLGLGGHIQMPREWGPPVASASNESKYVEVPENRVIFPSDMILITDSNGDGNWDNWTAAFALNMVPGEIHGGRKDGASIAMSIGGRTNVVFADGHCITMSRAELTGDPKDRSEIIVQRWNNDHKPHKEYWP